MEQALNGIRDTLYRELASGYRREGERSFLYKYFWQESAVELWEKVFPKTPAGERLTRGLVRERICEDMRRDPDRARLLREPPGETRRERRDFWQELMLNDAGYQAGLITDTEYYKWLTSYLAAREVYYKDSGPGDADGCAWLRPLLRAGLDRPDRGGTTKAQTERELRELALLLRGEDGAEALGRLHGLRQRVVMDGKEQLVDYLPWLTARLERAAIHIKIKTWLQDGGYSLRAEENDFGTPKSPRKQEFSLRLFDAFCAGAEGYELTPRGMDGWHMAGREFCAMDAKGVEPLLDAIRGRKDGGEYVYLPLALHLQSGCVFFLAGKCVYEDAYEWARKEEKIAYNRGEVKVSFDYLRLNRAFWDGKPGGAGGPFRLKATFHENAGRSFEEVYNDFERYCVKGTRNVLAVVRQLNEEAPSGTPGQFLWAFEPPEEPVRSRESREAFYRSRAAAQRAPAGPIV